MTREVRDSIPVPPVGALDHHEILPVLDDPARREDPAPVRAGIENAVPTEETAGAQHTVAADLRPVADDGALDVTALVTSEPAPDATPADEPEIHPEATAKVEAFLAAKGVKGLTKLATDDLRALYVDVIGRDTGSTHDGYLVWKIREAMKGRIPLGEVSGGGARSATPTDGEPVEQKVIPIRLPADTADAMDAAWRRHGFKSRMDFIRAALADKLRALNEADAATLVLGQAA